MAEPSKNRTRPETLNKYERWIKGLEEEPKLLEYYTKFVTQYGATPEIAMTLTRSLIVAKIADEATIEFLRLRALRPLGD